MRILICSDSHGRHAALIRAIEKEGPLDMVIHCGDIEDGEQLIREAAHCHLEAVVGNNDYFSDLPRETVFELGGKKVWLTHGHNYFVSLGIERLREEAVRKKVDVVFFGHTHRPFLEEQDDILFINPGSISYPRQIPRRNSYVMLTIDSNDHWKLEQKYIS
ncbi:MAG: metallophosphoesterase [Lachnospiraceae bacterium]|nr:metallophosphoesterase [Lachnospiraceae bacterium]